jgi:hypothetical protein
MTANMQRCRAILWSLDKGEPVERRLKTEIGTPYLTDADRDTYKAEAVTGFRNQKARIMNSGIGAVRIRRFSSTTYPGLRTAAAAVTTTHPHGLMVANANAYANGDGTNPNVPSDNQYKRGYRQSVRMMNKAAGMANKQRAIAVLWTKEEGQRPDPVLEQGIARMFVTVKGGRNIQSELREAIRKFLGTKRDLTLAHAEPELPPEPAAVAPAYNLTNDFPAPPAPAADATAQATVAV